MAHMIDESTGKAACAVVGEAAWHRLGKVLTNLQSSKEMIREAILDWLVEKQPLHLADGTKVPGAFATVRTDTGAALGVVGSNYVPFQNQAAFELMDHIVGEGLAMYETAGSLNGGKRVWIMARIPKEVRVAGTDDVVKPYALLTNRHDGGGAIRVLPTSVRVVCNNTLNMALRARGASKEGLSIRHTKNVMDAVEEARQRLGIIVQRIDTFQSQVDALAKVSLTETQVKGYFEQLYPVKKARRVAGADDAGLLSGIVGQTDAAREVVSELLAAVEEEKDRAAKRNAKILEQLLANFHDATNTLPGIEGTAWAAYNAASEYLDHQAPVRGKDETAKANNRMNSMFFGAGNEKKQEAFDLALQMAGATGLAV